jgi:hypothetical protein
VKYRDTQDAVSKASAGHSVEPGLIEYRIAIEKGWPDIAEQLVEGGFADGVRETETTFPSSDVLSQSVLEAWEDHLRTTIDTTARRLSGLLLQILFNAPAIALIGLITYQCVGSFVRGNYLSADYFRHALVTFLVVWILPFIIFQFISRAFGGERLVCRALKRLLAQVQDSSLSGIQLPIEEEIDTVLRLERIRTNSR